MKTCYIDRSSRTIIDLQENFIGTPGLLITRINTPIQYRGLGHASKLFKQVLKDADSEGVDLELWIMPSGGLGFEELKAWYEREGFKEFGEGREYLRRKARGSTTKRGDVGNEEYTTGLLGYL